MAARRKKKLELKEGEAAEAAGQEARYARAGRRLELQNPDGSTHRSFSASAGTVQVDRAELESHMQAQEADRTERMGKMREQLEREEAKFREIYPEEAPRSISPLLEKRLRILKAGLRAVYALVLIYLGARGVWQLVNLIFYPPTRGVAWHGFFTSMFLMGTAVLAWRLRRQLVAALDDPDHPVVVRWGLQDREWMRRLIYATEGFLALLGFSIILNFLFGIDILAMAPPYLFFFVGYFVVSFVVVRKLAADSIEPAIRSTPPNLPRPPRVR